MSSLWSQSEKSISGPEGKEALFTFGDLIGSGGRGFDVDADASADADGLEVDATIGMGVGRTYFANIDSRLSKAASRCGGITSSSTFSVVSIPFDVDLDLMGSTGGSPSRLPPRTLNPEAEL